MEAGNRQASTTDHKKNLVNKNNKSILPVHGGDQSFELITSKMHPVQSGAFSGSIGVHLTDEIYLVCTYLRQGIGRAVNFDLKRQLK